MACTMYACTCVHLCVGCSTCEDVYMHTQGVHRETDVSVRPSSMGLHLTFGDKIPCCSWNSQIRLDWLTIKPQEASCFHSQDMDYNQLLGGHMVPVLIQQELYQLSHPSPPLPPTAPTLEHLLFQSQ